MPTKIELFTAGNEDLVGRIYGKNVLSINDLASKDAKLRVQIDKLKTESDKNTTKEEEG